MRYRLAAIDIDGTLHNSSRAIPPGVSPRMRELEGRGVMVVLCTGRRYDSALPIAREAGVRSPMVLHSGALVRNPVDHATILRHYLAPEIAREIVAAMKSRGHHPIIWTDEYDAGIDMVSSPAPAGTLDAWYLDRHRGRVRLVENLELYESDCIFEVGAWGEFDDLARTGRAIADALGERVHHHVARWIIDDNSIFEMFDGAVSKWNALTALAAMRGIGPEQILAIGDNYNDIEMVSKAGMGVAMGNAVPELKAVAGHVTASNDEDGLLHALQRFFP